VAYSLKRCEFRHLTVMDRVRIRNRVRFSFSDMVGVRLPAWSEWNYYMSGS